MNYKAKNFDALYGTRGFSDELLKNHFTLYQGYVQHAVQLLEKLERLREEEKADSQEFMELKRRFGWEFNGMRLHEYYFGNLSREDAKIPEEGDLIRKLETSFGSVENWKKDFLAAGAMRGIGWVVLAYDAAAGRMLNLWVNEHDAGLGAGLPVLLVLDVFEHAYLRDYGVKKDAYLEAFFNAIDWDEVLLRFEEISAAVQHHRAA